MKTIYVLLLTVTTWANGDPTTTEIGYFKSSDECFKYAGHLVTTYRKTFPENVVHIVPGGIQCEDRDVTNRQYKKLLKQKKRG